MRMGIWSTILYSSLSIKWIPFTFISWTMVQLPNSSPVTLRFSQVLLLLAMVQFSWFYYSSVIWYCRLLLLLSGNLWKLWHFGIWRVFSHQILQELWSSFSLALNFTVNDYSLNDNIYITLCNSLTTFLTFIELFKEVKNIETGAPLAFSSVHSPHKFRPLQS